MIGRVLKGKSILLLALLTVLSLSSLAFAQGDKDIPRPERGFGIYSEFSGIYVAPGESIRLELTVENKGRTDENILLEIAEAPKGWKASLKAPNYTVNSVPVPATFSVMPRTARLQTMLKSVQPHASRKTPSVNGVYVPAMRRKIAPWSSTRNTRFTLFSRRT